MSIIIGIAGKIGSGKTYVANYISTKFNIHKASFGDYVRRQALDSHLSDDRKTLQDLGQTFVERDVNNFCLEVLKFSNWDYQSNLVIDGIRHFQVYNALKDIVSPIPFYLIYMSANSKIRNARLLTHNLKELDAHPTEIQLEKLMTISDLIIRNTSSKEVLNSRLAHMLNTLVEKSE